MKYTWWQKVIRFLDSAGADEILPEPTTLEYRNAMWRAEWTRKYYQLGGSL
jgi:hypothetical protein